MDFPSKVKLTLLQLIHQMGEDPSPFVQNPKKDFTRNRKLPFAQILLMIISMEASSLKKELLKTFHFETNLPSASAFCQQRAKLSIKAFYHILYQFNASFTAYLYRGFSLIACDGSELNLPLTLNDSVYDYRKREGQKNYFQLHMNTLYDLINHRYLDIIMESRKGHDERKAFLNMLSRGNFQKNTVFIMDRGYEGYGILGSIYRKGMYFVIRAKDGKDGGIIKGFHLKHKGEYDQSFTRTFTTSRSKMVVSQPDIFHIMHWSKNLLFLDKEHPYMDMTLRILRIQTAPGKYECLLTNLPPAQFPLSEMKILYHMRWKIETSFRDLKYTIGLNCLHAKKVEYIQQEIVAKMILYNFCSIITMHVTIKSKKRKYTYQINFNIAVFLCHKFLQIPADETPPDIKRLIAAELLPIRPDRIYKRKLLYHPAVSFNYRFN